jgi:hypothetical protein
MGRGKALRSSPWREKLSLLLRLWRGEVSLAVTYWVWAVLICIAVVALGIGSIIFDYRAPLLRPIHVLSVFILSVLVGILVWRSARTFAGWKIWAVLAPVMIILNILFQISYSQSFYKGSHDFPLKEAKHGFVTKLVRLERVDEPPDSPPPQLFRLVHFPSPVGKLAAYLSVRPRDGRKHPAIVWILGGTDNSIGATVWNAASPENDQSARAFRELGIVSMYPSFRGGNDNPGVKELFLGEVDDIISAAEMLAHEDYVDPNRIYLGGHSTGGTLVLLVAESTDRFRAVFSFGPVADIRGYGVDAFPFDVNDINEIRLRSPVAWLDSILTPTFVFEGGKPPTNIASMRALCNANTNRAVHFYLIPSVDHFSSLAVVTPMIARRILDDRGPSVSMTFGEEMRREGGAAK